GYDPYAAARLWKRMYDDRGDFGAMVSDHPVTSERYKSAMELARRYEQYVVPGQINPQHAEILASMAGGAGQRPAPGAGGGVLAILETTLGALGKHSEAKAEEAEGKQDRQFISYVRQSITVGKRKIGPR